MTMSEAFKCGGNDIPFIDGEFNSDKNFTVKGLRELSEYDKFKPWPTPKQQLSNEWQVQKAEPKVLTVDELVYADQKSFNDGEYPKLWWVADKADKNGQLREWLRPEQIELREAIKELLKTIPAPIDSYAAIVHHKLKYLKPPNQQ